MGKELKEKAEKNFKKQRKKHQWKKENKTQNNHYFDVHNDHLRKILV